LMDSAGSMTKLCVCHVSSLSVSDSAIVRKVHAGDLSISYWPSCPRSRTRDSTVSQVVFR
jgi:hypothetical protein